MGNLQRRDWDWNSDWGVKGFVLGLGLGRLFGIDLEIMALGVGMIELKK